LIVSNELFSGRLIEKKASIIMSSEQRRRALAESGITVVAHVMKDRELVAWAQSTGRAVYIGRNYRGWRDVGWGNPFRPQTHAPEEHDRVIALYTRYLDDDPVLCAGCLNFPAAKYYCAGVIRCRVTAMPWLNAQILSVPHQARPICLIDGRRTIPAWRLNCIAFRAKPIGISWSNPAERVQNQYIVTGFLAFNPFVA
jgi:hypothetical protein